MSHQSNVNIDEQLTETYRLDIAPQYRRDIFGQVFLDGIALKRKEKCLYGCEDGIIYNNCDVGIVEKISCPEHYKEV